MWFRLSVCVLVIEKSDFSHEGEVWLEMSLIGEAGNFMSLWISCGSAALCRLQSKTVLCSTERINRLVLHEPETWAAQMATRRKKKRIVSPTECEMCLSVSVETKQQSFKSPFYLFSDELGWVSFADEDFQQAQFGFNVLVFAVFHRQRGAVLLLYIPMGTRQQTLRNEWRFSCGKPIKSKSVHYASSPV